MCFLFSVLGLLAFGFLNAANSQTACDPGWPPLIGEPFTIALFQCSVMFGNKTYNLDKLANAAETAAVKYGANLIAVPELFTTGYDNFTVSEIIALAEYSDGESYQRIAKIATSYNISVVYSYVEKDGNHHMYDSAALVSNSGEMLVNYRKVHLSGSENYVFTAGTELGPVVDLNGVRIGLLICADISYPEAARALALQDADIIIVPTAQAAVPAMNGYSNMTIPSRANENILYVAYTNYVQDGDWISFHGLSRLSDPMYCSLIEGSTDTEQILVTTIYPEAWRETRAEYMASRQPATYYLICETDVSEE